jgi:hypothetical protein
MSSCFISEIAEHISRKFKVYTKPFWGTDCFIRINLVQNVFYMSSSRTVSVLSKTVHMQNDKSKDVTWHDVVYNFIFCINIPCVPEYLRKLQ